ncbi:hypothetical protein ACOMHN_026595 [Nucella lapillus]
MNSRWSSLLQEHTTSRTRAILEQGLFSDVDIIVQGKTFHCHRYVLAQHSQFFFSEFLKTHTPLTHRAKRAATQEPVLYTIPKLTSADNFLSADASDLPSLISAEVDSHKQHQDKLLEALGNPAGAASLEISGIGNQTFKSKLTSSGESRTRSSDIPRSDSHSPDASFSKIRVGSSPTEHRQTSSPKTEEQLLQRLSLKVNFLTPETFRAVIEAIYHHQDTVTAANILSIYKAANRLQITSLFKYCEEVIIQLLHNRTLDASDILYDYQMAENSSILKNALEVLLTDFGPDSSKADWFLKLSADRLFSVLTDPRLNVRSEDEVYRALMDWYEHDPCSRRRHVPTSLTLLRLANLNKRILVEEILPHPLCSAGPQTLREGSDVNGDGSDVSQAGELVRQALTYHLLADRRHDELLPIADFRPSQDWERVLLVLGDQSAQLYAFSFARRAWFRLAPPPKALGLGVAACTHGDDLYVTGGDKAMTSCYRYRAAVNTWTQLGALKAGRRSHGCVALGECLYALGGKDDRQSFKKDTLDSIEVFHIRDKAEGWQLVKESALVVPVRSMACVAHGEHIYVLGGRTNGLQQTVDALQCFDTRTHQCSLVGHLPSPSCLARSFILNKVIYLLDTNGDVLCFHPKNLAGSNFPAPAGHPKKASQHPQNIKGTEDSRISLLQTNMLQRVGLEQETSLREGERNQADFAEPVTTKVGRVLNLDWKWFGAARSHAGTLYVVAGECPANFVAADFCSLSASVEDSDDVGVFKQVCFIRPEKMVMCYVSSHMCIPKSFLVKKLV